MRIAPIPLAIAVALGLVGPAAAESPPPKAETCGEYGTSVHFEETPADAAKEAKKAEKLVMVLHVSGHFENPEFT
ncbi:MAG TPA: hypothetical protein VM597_13540 [Gemmataceae bacterium]|jgi:hypothetical protein|nr:hypothetical protein [Gemmataceae bacterium]